MKIVVYAIAKNESSFVDRWMDSMSEADQVVVLDTGSDDGTAERLRARGVLLRGCANYPGLGPGWYRAAVRTHSENSAFLQALGEVL